MEYINKEIYEDIACPSCGHVHTKFTHEGFTIGAQTFLTANDKDYEEEGEPFVRIVTDHEFRKRGANEYESSPKVKLLGCPKCGVVQFKLDY